MKKCGANRIDQIKIQQFKEKGWSAAEIGKFLDIETDVVEKFMVDKDPVEVEIEEAETEVDEDDDNPEDDFK